MIARARIVHDRIFSRPLLVGMAILTLAVLATVLLAANQGARSVIAARLGLGPAPTFAYTIIDGHISRIDSATGAILAQSPDLGGEQFPSLAVSHDGQSVFYLQSIPEDGYVNDQMVTLSATTLSAQTTVPLQHFGRSMDAWPPALAVTADDRTVIVYQGGLGESDPYWLSYYDRQTGRLSLNTTILLKCGVSQLLPVQQQLAVLCMQTHDLRVVDLRSHQVTATLVPGLTAAGVLGSPLEAGVIPGQAAVAVVLDHGSLVRADLATQTVSLIVSLVPPHSEFEPVAAAFSANGRAAVLLGAKGGDRSGTGAVPLFIVDISDGHILDRLSVDSRGDALTIAPDGQRVWIVGNQDVLNEVDLTTHRVRSFGPDPARIWPHLIFADR